MGGVDWTTTVGRLQVVGYTKKTYKWRETEDSSKLSSSSSAVVGGDVAAGPRQETVVRNGLPTASRDPHYDTHGDGSIDNTNKLTNAISWNEDPTAVDR